MFLLTCTLEKECRINFLHLCTNYGVEILYLKRKRFLGKIFINNEIQVEYVFWKIMADERNVSTIFKVLICPDMISFSTINKDKSYLRDNFLLFN